MATFPAISSQFTTKFIQRNLPASTVPAEMASIAASLTGAAELPVTIRLYVCISARQADIVAYPIGRLPEAVFSESVDSRFPHYGRVSFNIAEYKSAFAESLGICSNEDSCRERLMTEERSVRLIRGAEEGGVGVGKQRVRNRRLQHARIVK